MDITRPDDTLDFWPDDDDDTMYLSSNGHTPFPLHLLLNLCQQKWPGITLEKLSVDTRYIHTHSVNYNRHDPSDWTNFLVVKKEN